MIKKVPFPICGVMLGTAALGNLLQSYSETVRNVCGILAAFLLVLILLKLVKYPSTIKEDLDTPIMAGVAATFPMALMILSTYVKPFIGQGAYFVWMFAIVLHIILIVYFTVKFVLKYNQKKVFTTWFIVYVGIAVAGVTAPAYEKTGFGAATFWFGLITLIPLLVIVIKRYTVHPLPDPVKPLTGIFAAPMSLCIAAYIQSVQVKNYTLLMGMFVVATVLYVYSLVVSLGLLKKFYPSFAGFTFPFVISAIATKQTMACSALMGHPLPWLSNIVLAETVIATAFVAFVYVKYMVFIFAGNAGHEGK